MRAGEHSRTMAMVMIGSSRCLMATLGMYLQAHTVRFQWFMISHSLWLILHKLYKSVWRGDIIMGCEISIDFSLLWRQIGRVTPNFIYLRKPFFNQGWKIRYGWQGEEICIIIDVRCQLTVMWREETLRGHPSTTQAVLQTALVGLRGGGGQYWLCQAGRHPVWPGWGFHPQTVTTGSPGPRRHRSVSSAPGGSHLVVQHQRRYGICSVSVKESGYLKFYF